MPWVGDPAVVDAYVSVLLRDPAYLHECFDLATPASFLYDFVRRMYVDSQYAIFLSDDVMMMQREGGDHIECRVSEGMDRIVPIWYDQCAQVCTRLMEQFDIVRSKAEPIRARVSHPKSRPRLQASVILQTLRMLLFRYKNRIDLPEVVSRMTRMCKFAQRLREKKCKPLLLQSPR